jgi:hypothetical protein
MEEIFKLYEHTKDENFIGHDKSARDIIDKASMSFILISY